MSRRRLGEGGFRQRRVMREDAVTLLGETRRGYLRDLCRREAAEVAGGVPGGSLTRGERRTLVHRHRQDTTGRRRGGQSSGEERAQHLRHHHRNRDRRLYRRGCSSNNNSRVRCSRQGSGGSSSSSYNSRRGHRRRRRSSREARSTETFRCRRNSGSSRLRRQGDGRRVRSWRSDQLRPKALCTSYRGRRRGGRRYRSSPATTARWQQGSRGCCSSEVNSPA